MDRDFDRLARRIERLERTNRWLWAACLALPALALVGWQAAGPVELLRVRKLEVVDARGVPLVTLAPDRNESGGSITLRDSLGEKRGWWRTAPEGSSLTMTASKGEQPDSTIGFSVHPEGSQFSLISPSGASMAGTMERDVPRLELWNRQGKSLFAAPWKAPGER